VAKRQRRKRGYERPSGSNYSIFASSDGIVVLKFREINFSG
jgi:hypothetical protein